MNLKLPESIGLALRRLNIAVLAFSVCLGAGSVGAADSGPRHHAEGAFDGATGAYAVVEGDDLDAIAERFGVTVAELKQRNELHSDSIEVGEKLTVAAPAIPAEAPGATTTIPGSQLPAPQPEFGGVIKDDALESKPWWAPRIVPPKEAPNILLIITDDAGFAVPSTFGGVIPTLTLDRVANAGLRYNNIHSTALCSPMRAALITGRNHHSAGFGVITGVADDAIDYLNRVNQTMPSKPFFVKYAPGATHAPHHSTKEWVEKIRENWIGSSIGCKRKIGSRWGAGSVVLSPNPTS